MRDNAGLPELPKGWVWARLGEVCDVNPRLGIPEDLAPEALVTFVPMAGVSDVRGAITGAETRPLHEVTRGYTRFAEGDVIFAKITPCMENGKAAVARGLVSGFGFGSTEFHVLRPSGALTAEWLYHLVRQHSFRDAAAAAMTGTAGQLRVPSRFLVEAPVALPPRGEQFRIVAKLEELLTLLDAGVEALLRVQAQLRRYRQAVLKAAFEGRLTEEWRQKHGAESEPASAWLRRLSAARGGLEVGASLNTSCLPELPDGWAWSTVGAVGEVSGGLTKNSKRAKLPRKMPYLRVANVYAAELRLDEVKTIGVEEQEIERALLRRGDLLVVEGNGSRDQIGRVAVWDGSINPCLHQNHIIKVRFAPTEVAEFALLWLLSEAGRDQITQVASSTSGLYTLSISKVGSLPMPVAPLAEWREIVAEVERRLSVADQLETAVEQGLKRAERLRQSILKRAFEGKLVPQDPADEPAAVLLERIRAERSAKGTKGHERRGKTVRVGRRRGGQAKQERLL